MRVKILILLALALMCTAAPYRAEAGWPFGPDSGGESMPKGDTVYATTPDGWKIAITHFSPNPIGEAKEHAYPVIVCHGFGYNSNFWMLDASANLPVYLSQQGYDVWVPSLRGSGNSTKWMYKMAEVGSDAMGVMKAKNDDNPMAMLMGAVKMVQGINNAQLKNASMDPKYMNWTYDDYVNGDVPTIIDFVKDQTGKKKVHWVGHSMGGNILLCYLTQNPKANSDIASIFTAGSQLTMKKGTVMNNQLKNLEAQRLLELKGGDLSKAKEISTETNNKMFFNTANADSRIVDQLNAIGSDTPSMGVLGQYMNLSDTGKYASNDKKVDYTEDAKNIKAPAFFSAGRKDAFVNIDDLEFLKDNTGSKKKEVRVYGIREGFSVDYGHNDAFISPAAGREIYPVVDQWLASNEKKGLGLL